MFSTICPSAEVLHISSAFSIGDTTTALHRFAVILDPLSEQAQKYTSLFEVFTGLIIRRRSLRTLPIQWLSHIPTVTIEFHLQPSQYAEVRYLL